MLLPPLSAVLQRYIFGTGLFESLLKKVNYRFVHGLPSISGQHFHGTMQPQRAKNCASCICCCLLHGFISFFISAIARKIG